MHIPWCISIVYAWSRRDAFSPLELSHIIMNGYMDGEENLNACRPTVLVYTASSNCMNPSILVVHTISSGIQLFFPYLSWCISQLPTLHHVTQLVKYLCVAVMPTIRSLLLVILLGTLFYPWVWVFGYVLEKSDPE